MSAKREVIPLPVRAPDTASGSGQPLSMAVRGGDFLFVSGLAAIDLRSGERMQGTTASETRQILTNLSRNSNLPHVPGIRVGDYIFLSGMVPVDPQTGERSHGPIAEQVRVTLSNMRHMLESAGSSLERVLRVHVVLADISHMAERIGYIVNFSG